MNFLLVWYNWQQVGFPLFFHVPYFESDIGGRLQQFRKSSGHSIGSVSTLSFQNNVALLLEEGMILRPEDWGLSAFMDLGQESLESC